MLRRCLLLLLAAAAVAASDDEGKALLLRARALANQGQADAAEALLVEAERVMPRSPEPIMLRGNLLAFLRRKPEEAIDLYRAAIALAPTFEAHFFLGKALATLERWSDAAEAYRSASDLAPNNPAPLLELSAALTRGGDWPTGRDALRSAAALDRHSPSALVSLAQASTRYGTLDEAISAHRDLTELHPWHAQHM
eukprot:6540106-Prymnesium_polylepis.1